MFWCCCNESPPPPPPPSIVVYVYGCGGRRLPGATVTIAGVGSGATDANGYYSASVPSYGTYTVTATKTRFGARLASVTVSAVVPTATVHLNLEQNDGHVCCSGCPDPIPEILYLTTSHGTVTLTNLGGGPTCLWFGSRDITSGNAIRGVYDAYMECQEDIGTYPVAHQYYLNGPVPGPGGVFRWTLTIHSLYVYFIDCLTYEVLESPPPAHRATGTDCATLDPCHLGGEHSLRAYLTGDGCGGLPLSGTLTIETPNLPYPDPIESGSVVVDE